MTRNNIPILHVFLGGPDAPNPDVDILSKIRDRALRRFNGVNSSYKVIARRYREPPDIVQPEPGVNVQATIDAELAAGVYDIAIFVFRDRLGSPHPDGYKSYTVKELEDAIALRRADKSTPARPHIMIYKAEKSWRSRSESELGKLSSDTRQEIRDIDRKRQDEHILVYSYLEELQSAADHGVMYTVYTDEHSDDNLIDGALNVIENYAVLCERLHNATGVLDTRLSPRESGWPFPGIRDFAMGDWEIFYGREDKIQDVWTSIETGRRIITINGGSGSGKTSLLQAGILGNMRFGNKKSEYGDWVYLDIEPHPTGLDLFDKLAIKFEDILKPRYGGGDNARRLKAVLDSIFVEPPRGANFDYEKASAEFRSRFVSRSIGVSPSRRLVIAINQAEYIAANDGLVRSQFLRFVTSAAMCEDVVVLMTLRDDTFGPMRSDPIIEHQVPHWISSIWLSPPDAAELSMMIEGPAGLAKLYVEPKFLKRIRVDATARGGDSLPLVAQCLNAMCKRANKNKLTLAEYEAVGGLSGVVAGQARELEDLIAPDVLLKLFEVVVRPGIGGRLERNIVPIATLHSLGVPRNFLLLGIENRLIQETTISDTPSIRLQHDILLEAWPTLKTWIDTQRIVFDQRRAVLDDANRWDHSGRDDRNIRLSESLIPLLASLSLYSDLNLEDADASIAIVRDYIGASKRKVARQNLVAAVNAGLPSEIRKAITEGAMLTEAERGEGIGQLRPQFWAAVTGDDAVDEDLYIQRARPSASSSESRRRSVFDDPKMVVSSVTRGLSIIHLAALCGQTDLVRRLVRDYGANPSMRTERGGTPLSHAAYCGRREICEFFIDECGVKADCLDDDGSSAALWAAQQGYSDLAKYLQDKGAPLDVTVIGGWNRLTESVRSGSLAAVKAAIAAGYSPHQPTEQGLTVALVACQNLRSEVLKYLLEEHEVDLTVRDKEGRTAYDLVCLGIDDVEPAQRRQKAEETIGVLAPRLPVDMMGFGGERALILAVSVGAVEVAEALLRHGANIEATGPTATIPLFAAVSEGQALATRLLLNMNANVNTSNFQQLHALHIAALGGNVDILEILLGRPDIRVNVQDGRGFTPLLLAAATGKYAAVKCLLDHGASPRIPAIDRSDALNAALVAGHQLVVKELLRDKLIAGSLFELASEDASKTDAPATDQFGGMRGWPSRTHLLLAATSGRPDMIDMLVRAGVDPNATDPAGDTALHDAARLHVGSAVAVQGILPFMRDISAKNLGGHTAAELAVAAGNDAVAQILVTGDTKPIWWNLPKVSEGLPFLTFDPLTKEHAEWVNALLDSHEFWCKVLRDGRQLHAAKLPFSEGAALLVIEDTDRKGPREQFALIRWNRDFVPMNWTNEPIYSSNERWGVNFDEETVLKYAKFFFHMVRGYLGRFRIVERPEDIIWAGEVSAETREAVELRIRPLAFEEDGFKNDRAVMGTTVIFKNALFFTKILISFRRQTIVGGDGIEELMTPGQGKLFDEELLLEDLPVYVDPPPSTWG